MSVRLEDIPSTTVKVLKSLIFAQDTSAKNPMGSAQDVNLIFAGKVLEDDNKTLGEYGIKERGQSIQFIPSALPYQPKKVKRRMIYRPREMVDFDALDDAYIFKSKRLNLRIFIF